jgi:hypothetical protein
MPTSRQPVSPASACFCIVGDERRKGGNSGCDVGGKHLLERRQVFRVFGQRAARDTGIGDDDVDAVLRGDEISGGRCQRGMIVDVERIDAMTLCIRQTVGQFTQCVAASCGKSERCALRLRILAPVLRPVHWMRR